MSMLIYAWQSGKNYLGLRLDCNCEFTLIARLRLSCYRAFLRTDTSHARSREVVAPNFRSGHTIGYSLEIMLYKASLTASLDLHFTTMSTEKTSSPVHSHVQYAQGDSVFPPTVQPAITLTPEQYERLFFQPQGARDEKARDFAKRFGNPTPAGLVSFLLVLTPTAWCLMQINETTTASLTVLVGPYFFIGGMSLWAAGILEWVSVTYLTVSRRVDALLVCR
jgi:hypothetical protein